MTDVSSTDVLICGARATSLTLAIDLARRGISFHLVEKAQSPFGGSRGKGLQPRTLEVFEDLGFIDRIAAVGGPYPNQRTYRPDGTQTDEAMFAEAKLAPDEPYCVPLIVMQGPEQVMRERLAELGRRPHYGCALTGFDQDARLRELGA